MCQIIRKIKNAPRTKPFKRRMSHIKIILEAKNVEKKKLEVKKPTFVKAFPVAKALGDKSVGKKKK